MASVQTSRSRAGPSGNQKPGGPPKKKRSYSRRKPFSKRSKKRKLDPLAEYSVEKIMNKRFNEGSLEYLLKWKNYGIADCSWEPFDNVFATNLVEQYENLVITRTDLSTYVLVSETSVSRLTGITRINGETFFIAEYNDGKLFTMPLSFVKEKLPMKLRQFLLRNRDHICQPLVHEEDIPWG